MYSHIYFHLKKYIYIYIYIYTLKISSTLAKLPMEKPGNCFAITKNMRKASGEERNIKEKTCIFSEDFPLGWFSDSACANLVSRYAEHRLQMNYCKQLMSSKK